MGVREKPDKLPICNARLFGAIVVALSETHGSRAWEPWFAELIVKRLEELERGYQELPARLPAENNTKGVA